MHMCSRWLHIHIGHTSKLYKVYLGWEGLVLAIHALFLVSVLGKIWGCSVKCRMSRYGGALKLHRKES